jgi:signal transduction histidine kinase
MSPQKELRVGLFYGHRMLSLAPDEVAFTQKPQRYGLPASETPPSVVPPSDRLIERHNLEASEKGRLRQRAVSERLLLGVLRERAAAHRAMAAEERAKFLASAARDLAMSLDRGAVREIVRRSALPRDGSWCIVDLVESSGAIRRLAVAHPDPAKEALARSLEDPWNPASDTSGAPIAAPLSAREPRVITQNSAASLVAAAHGARNLELLRKLGFGALLVVPLVLGDRCLGAITFVTREGDAPLSDDEITLASELADRCAIALDHARLYAQADELREAADAANRGKSTFLGNMTHELLAPLNAIGGFAGIMEMELHGPVTSEQRADLERIKRNQEHLVSLISGILEYVRSESGHTEYHPERLPVGALMREVAEMLASAAAGKDLGLRVQSSEDQAPLWADPVRVRQILVNLVTNAVKYSPDGAGGIVLSATAGPDVVRIQVSDAGSGIPREQLGAIFEPFVQLKGGLRDRQGGVGLGLAISRDLARGMNGDITVESTVGTGSRFTLTLPRAG